MSRILRIGRNGRMIIKVIDDQAIFYYDDNPIGWTPNNNLLIRIIDDEHIIPENVDVILTKQQLKPIIKALKKKLKELT